MNDINDKLIEGLEEYKIKVELLQEREVSWTKEIVDKDKQIDNTNKYVKELKEELKEKDLIIHAIKTDQVSYKVDIVNDWTDMTASDIPPKQIKVSEYIYAFVDGLNSRDEICLWLQTEDVTWIEVSDLTELKVWEYQEIKSYAVAVGMIKEDEDLFI